MGKEISLSLQVLLEEYRSVSEEIRIYLQEMIKCFPYAAIFIALYLGWGIEGQGLTSSSLASKIKEYVPYGFVLLSVYFLSLAYIRVGLSRYRASLEKKINDLAGNDLMLLDSKYVGNIQSMGFLRFGNSWYERVPTPMLFLGFLIMVTGLLVFSLDSIKRQTGVILALLFACVLITLYVFFIYPRLIDQANKISKKK